jgi:hypothetical protein
MRIAWAWHAVAISPRIEHQLQRTNRYVMNLGSTPLPSGQADAGDEGYLLMAVERQKYFDMACNLACSIRVFDQTRKIALIVDDHITVDDRKLFFDFIVPIENKSGYVGVMHKIRLFPYSPFQRTMFIDSDCLMVKPNVSEYWKAFSVGCNALGHVMNRGSWKGLKVENIAKHLGLPHIVYLNAGVMYFDKSDKSRDIFEYMQEIFKSPQGITTIHQKRAGQYSMEPILGAALAKFEVSPMSILPNVGSLMVTTLHARRVHVDPGLGVSYLEKPDTPSHLASLIPGLCTWTCHSPILMHFIGLKPENLYRKISAHFHALAGAKSLP